MLLVQVQSLQSISNSFKLYLRDISKQIYYTLQFRLSAGKARIFFIAFCLIVLSTLVPAVAKARIANIDNASAIPTNKPNSDITPAAFSGMARSLPVEIRPAAANVKTGCFNPELISLLKIIQKKYGRTILITSGFRSHTHNASIGGAKDSAHTRCIAADIKVPGVSKYKVARFVRSLPNRGGVGLYCHNAVHVDTGPRRDWNWCKIRKH